MGILTEANAVLLNSTRFPACFTSWFPLYGSNLNVSFTLTAPIDPYPSPSRQLFTLINSPYTTCPAPDNRRTKLETN